ncbi:MAG: hypothetical protein H6721_17360 [Sandaracinus sp.]|nr:hypothetical protein [Sandaracinus sp.]MCB9633890.1 hypothetical protein [Sandaracinus sp.]
MLELSGGCHCGAIRFTVRCEAREAIDCDCSICTKKGFLHLIVARTEVSFPAGDLDAMVADGRLAEYRFGTRTARHTFCARCGMHPFYVPPAASSIRVAVEDRRGDRLPRRRRTGRSLFEEVGERDPRRGPRIPGSSLRPGALRCPDRIQTGST